MKKLNVLICLLVCLGFPLRAENTQPAMASVTLEVSDDSGVRLPGIPVSISTLDHWEAGEGFGRNKNRIISGITDKMGRVSFNFPCITGKFSYRISDSIGFYRDQGDQFSFKKVEKGEWLPANPIIPIIYKPILNPTAMYAKSVDVVIPKGKGPFGFDLLQGDWLEPWGKGKNADLLFSVIGYWNRYDDYDLKLIVAFSSVTDGLQKFVALPQNKGSIFRSPRYAPDGGYLPLETLTRSYSQGGKVNFDDTQIDKRSSYFFRIRTKVGKGMDLSNGFYGKIYDGFEFGNLNESATYLRFTYYVNSASRDLNLEFDRTKNLLIDQSGVSGITFP